MPDEGDGNQPLVDLSPVEYRSFRRLIAFAALSAVYTFVALAILDGFTNFQFWMLGLLACIWLPPCFVVWAVRLDEHDRLELRSVVRRRRVPVSSVRSIELTNELPRSVRLRFERGRSARLRDSPSALQLSIAIVRCHPTVDVSGFDAVFELDA